MEIEIDMPCKQVYLCVCAFVSIRIPQCKQKNEQGDRTNRVACKHRESLPLRSGELEAVSLREYSDALETVEGKKWEEEEEEGRVSVCDERER